MARFFIGFPERATSLQRNTKKPLEISPQGVLSPRILDSFSFSSGHSPVRSMRTVHTDRDDRSWFGSRSQAKKRRGPTLSQFDASPLHRKSIRKLTWGSTTGRRHRDKTTNRVRGSKKGAVPPAPLMTHSHHLTKGCSEVRETKLCRHPYKRPLRRGVRPPPDGR